MSSTLKVFLVAGVTSIILACGETNQPPHFPEAGTATQAKPKRKKSERLPQLDPARVVFAMRSNELDVRRCFFRAPSARGFVRMTWRVDTSGSVQDVAIEKSTIQNEAVEQCLVARVSELRFGDVQEPAKAQWTYAFRVAQTQSGEKAKHKGHSKQRKSTDETAEPGVVIEHTSPGRLEPDQIDNVVQSGFPLFAHCFRSGIDRNSRLGGTVRLRFVIDKNGAVSRVLDGESDLPDKMMIDCVAEGFYALRFPKPEQGSVHVLYRVQFE